MTKSYQTLKDIILHYAEDKKYFSIEMLREILIAEKHTYANQTLKQTLNQLVKEKSLFDAGRGWYSTIERRYVLDSELIDPFIKQISEKYPFLPFCCWSTGQLRSHAHHMMARHVIFLYVERDLMPDIFDYLRSIYQAYLNPTQKEANKSFTAEEKTLVIRPSISRQPEHIHYATIEKILVDLLIEMRALWLMDDTEYSKIFNDVIFNNRIDISLLLKYSEIRKVRKEFEQLGNIPKQL